MRRTASVDDDGPRYLRLNDGRLLTWFSTAPDHVAGFPFTFDEWVGTQPMPADQALGRWPSNGVSETVGCTARSWSHRRAHRADAAAGVADADRARSFRAGV